MHLRFRRLSLGLGLGVTGGACWHARPSSARANAAIAAAGPGASLAIALVAAASFVALTGSSLHSAGGLAFAFLAVGGLVDAIHNGWPRAGRAGAYAVAGNDGYHVARDMGWLAPQAFIIGGPLRDAPSPATPAPDTPTPPLLRPWAAVLLALVLVLAVLVDPLLALVVIGLFGLAALQTGEQQHADRMHDLHAGDGATID